VTEQEKATEKTADAAGGQGGQGQEGGKGEVEFSEEQQEALNRIIADRLSRAKSAWQKDLEKAEAAAAEKARKEQAEAEAQRLAEQEEFQKLAEKRAEQVTALEAQVTELSSLQERLGAYQETVEGLLEARVKALGEGAATAVAGLPGEPDALSRLQWLTANEGLFKQESKGAGLGTPAGRPKQRAPQTGAEERRPYRRPTL
jgi:DNA repair exonuclease SbcCD ATPase subunit